MRWFVQISPMGGQAGDEATLTVEAPQWQPALQKARAIRGHDGALSNFSIELLDDGYRAIDPTTRLRYVVRRAPDDAQVTPEISPGAAANAGHSSTPAQKGSAPDKAVAAGLPSFVVVSSREDNPSDSSPLTYREFVYAVAGDTPEDDARALIVERFDHVRGALDPQRSGRFINMAVFDHVFQGRPQRRPLVTLTWKDWKGERPELQFPLREAASGSDTPAPFVPRTSSMPVPASMPAPAPKPVSTAAIAAPVKPEISKSPPVNAGGTPAPPAAEAAPVKAAEPAAPVKPEVAKPAPVEPAPKAVEAAPVKAVEVVPVKTIEAAPVKAIEAAPVKAVEAAPVKTVEAAPAKAVEVVPVKTVEPAPAKAAEPAPAKAVEPAPAKAVEPAPVKAVEPAPVPPAPVPVEVAVKPAEQAPAPAAPANAGGAPAPPVAAAPKPSTRPKRLAGDDLLVELFEACGDLHFVRDSLEGAEFVLHLTQEKLPSELGLVSLFDMNTREFVVVRQSGGAKSALCARQPEKAPLAASAMRKRHSIVVADAEGAARAMDDRFRAIGVEVKSLVCAPVELNGRYLGLIELVNPSDGHAFSEGDGNALTYIGQQFAEFVAQRGVIVDPAQIRGEEPAAAASSPRIAGGAPMSSAGKKGR
jgi:hypothetical protein